MAYPSYDIQRTVFPSTLKDYWSTTLEESAKTQLKNSSSFLPVDVYNKNTKVYTTVDARVVKISSAKPAGQSSTSTNNTDDYREILFGDFSTVVNVGDRFRFADHIWLTAATDNINQVTKSCVVRRCNNYLRWYDSLGNLFVEPCAILDKMDDSGNSFDRSMVLPNGAISIIAQATDNVKTIKRNQRFLFGGQAFKVESVKNFISDLYTFDLYLDNIHEEYDDTINNIADAGRWIHTISIDQGDFETSIGFTGQLSSTILQNGSKVIKPVVWSTSNPLICTINSTGVVNVLTLGSVVITCKLADDSSVTDSITISAVATPTVTKTIVINPVINKLLETAEQVFTIYKFENGVQQADAFTCTASNAVAGSYALTTLTGNSIKLENLKYYDNNSVTITATSNVDATFETMTIKLGGLW